MAIVKSKIIDQLKKSFPNFLKKDLDLVVSTVLDEIKQALKRGERVELRNHGVYETHTQKPRISRNPKSTKRLNTSQETK